MFSSRHGQVNREEKLTTLIISDRWDSDTNSRERKIEYKNMMNKVREYGSLTISTLASSRRGAHSHTHALTHTQVRTHTRCTHPRYSVRAKGRQLQQPVAARVAPVTWHSAPGNRPTSNELVGHVTRSYSLL